jgi:hypothetical protein
MPSQLERAEFRGFVEVGLIHGSELLRAAAWCRSTISANGPVSPRVGNVKNNDPSLIEPIATA